MIAGAYTPFIQNPNFKMLKNLGQKIDMYISTFYVHMQCFAEDQQFLCVVLKRQKKMSPEMSYFKPRFCLVTPAAQNVVLC